jgi:hypothetical protein
MGFRSESRLAPSCNSCRDPLGSICQTYSNFSEEKIHASPCPGVQQHWGKPGVPRHYKPSHAAPVRAPLVILFTGISAFVRWRTLTSDAYACCLALLIQGSGHVLVLQTVLYNRVTLKTNFLTLWRRLLYRAAGSAFGDERSGGGHEHVRLIEYGRLGRLLHRGFCIC